jgi:hypothetical protein
MPTPRIDVAIRAFAGATLLVTLLAGCGKPAAPEAVPAPPPAAADPAGGEPAPASDSAPVDPNDVPAAPAQPAPEAPPPQEPSAAPSPAALSEPGLDSMSSAQASAKLSVPVDLRYRLDGPVLPNQPVMLHLAAIPRVAGSQLKVSVKPVSGLQIASAGSTAIQKVTAAGVYRQQISITAGDGAPTSIRVLVTMDMEQGAGFGFFTVPLEGGPAAQKQKSVKQR